MKKLFEIIAETFEINVSEVDNSQELSNFEMWDSMTHMFLITNIEKKFGVQLTNEEIMEMQTVQKIIDILKKRNIEIK